MEARKTLNRAGNRNFCVRIESQDKAERLTDEGWNIHQLAPIDDGDHPTYYVEVPVSYKAAPPMSLKKFEILLDIHHQELGLPWDRPVPKELWTKVLVTIGNQWKED